MASPGNLFDISLNTIVYHHPKLLSDIRRLPGSLQCDVYRQVNARIVVRIFLIL